MGQTIIEKILERASGTSVRAGDRIWARLDLVAMRDFGGPNAILEYESAFGDREVFDGSKVAFTFDLHVPPRNERVAMNQQICRRFAAQHGTLLFDVESGIGQHVLMERGHVRPWDVIIGTDSHMNLLGVFGAFASGVGTTDIAAGMAGGELWFKVPQTLKFVIRGSLGDGVSAKDVILHILREVGTDGALYKSVEFSGETVRSLSLAGRITLTSMVTEMSGKAALMEPDEKVFEFLKGRTNAVVEPLSADADAEYERVLEFDVSGLEPLIACPHSPDLVKPVREVQGAPIDQVFIGSCTNGRIEDLTRAARILDGHRVKDGLRLIVVPATQEVTRQAVEQGLMEIFVRAGAIVTNPGCALCTTGHPGILAEGETMVSTSNRNFVGKLGKGGFVYLASPATAAISAIRGEITDPREGL
jgi:homoaconitate hydratase family protein